MKDKITHELALNYLDILENYVGSNNEELLELVKYVKQQEKREELLEIYEKFIVKIYHITRYLWIIENAKGQEKPIKNTSRQACYKAICEIQNMYLEVEDESSRKVFLREIKEQEKDKELLDLYKRALFLTNYIEQYLYTPEFDDYGNRNHYRKQSEDELIAIENKIKEIENE